MTEKSFFAGFGGAREGTRTGERVTADYGNMACPQINVAIKEKVKGGAREGTRTGERVTANYCNTACPQKNVIIREKSTGGRK